jgi:hypothetical protein
MSSKKKGEDKERPLKEVTAAEKLVNSLQFDLFMMVVIILNSVWIASEDYGEDAADQALYIKVGTYIFNIIFVTEAIFKISVLGFKKYINDDFNKLDFLVSIFSAIELIFDLIDVLASAIGNSNDLISSVRGKYMLF